MRPAALLLVVILASGLAAVGVAGYRWNAESRELRDRLHAGAPGTMGLVRLDDLVGLPAPVQRYFRLVLRDGQPMVRAVRLRQRGQFLVRPESNGWAPFTATHEIGTSPGGFVWDARIRVAPGIAIRVRDGFVDGAGSMYGAVLGILPVVKVRGTPDIAIAALQRYLAEAVWAPSSLLPSAGVTWVPVDDSTARASLTVGRASATLDFRFGPDGLVSSVHAEARGRAVGDSIVPTPWHGRWFEWAERDGMLVPVLGEVEWQLPAGAQPYWRARVTGYEAEPDSRGRR
jgi:hypothetical protein